MKIVTTTSVLPGSFDISAMLDELQNCGFSDLDMAFYASVSYKEHLFKNDSYEEWAYGVRNEADKRGISFYQGHASFDVTYPKPEIEEKTFRCASVLGIKYLVVHPHVNDWEKELPGEPPYSHPFGREEFISLNKPRYERLIGLAEKYGVIMLSENLLWGDGAKLTVMSELVEAVHSPWFGWCLDTGHAINQGESLESLLECKHPPLSLHTHDCYGVDKGDHLIPGDGSIDWHRFMCILKEIGYTGELVLEADSQPRAAAEKDRTAVLRKLYERAKALADVYEQL
ncbi:MAG: sugar phosphate isomerase/epimerase [Clostridia bacterium]|nr:sugar phosphate isomerase/epimerase [Clostridia bacterium]